MWSTSLIHRRTNRHHHNVAGSEFVFQDAAGREAAVKRAREVDEDVAKRGGGAYAPGLIAFEDRFVPRKRLGPQNIGWVGFWFLV